MRESGGILREGESARGRERGGGGWGHSGGCGRRGETDALFTHQTIREREGAGGGLGEGEGDVIIELREGGLGVGAECRQQSA
jgi:hypothetical protein